MSAFLTLPELERRLGITKSTIYRRMNPAAYGYDPAFPRPFLEAGRLYWPEDRVCIWQDMRRLERMVSEDEDA